MTARDHRIMENSDWTKKRTSTSIQNLLTVFKIYKKKLSKDQEEAIGTR